MQRISAFGLTLATMDVRQHAEVTGGAINELVDRVSDDIDSFESLSVAERAKCLIEELRSRRVLSSPGAQYSPETTEILDLVRTIKEVQDRYGTNVIESWIVAMTRDVDDLLTILVLCKEAGLINIGIARPMDSDHIVNCPFIDPFQ